MATLTEEQLASMIEAKGTIRLHPKGWEHGTMQRGRKFPQVRHLFVEGGVEECPIPDRDLSPKKK